MLILNWHRAKSLVREEDIASIQRIILFCFTLNLLTEMFNVTCKSLKVSVTLPRQQEAGLVLSCHCFRESFQEYVGIHEMIKPQSLRLGLKAAFFC